jgi:site-specific recombinase XerD
VTLSVIVRTLVWASGIHFSPHNAALLIRHPFLRRCELHVVRDLAGHSHLETTLIYTKVFSKDRNEALRRAVFGKLVSHF